MSKQIININTDSALDVVNEVDFFYENIKETINTINTEKEKISNYWTSVEASNFISQMDTLSTNFSNFDEHYSFFIKTIKEILKLYDMEEESILAAIRSYQMD
ncbi:MAG: hypothetical protein IJI60_03855 [Bacilli bacterium]|nr:hypothetical protein [Bacilli bacterium]